MALNMRSYTNSFKNTERLISKPTTSLRLAFWSLLLTSGIYWALALVLGGLLLTSCSGSIYSDKKESTTSAVAPADVPPPADVKKTKTQDSDATTPSPKARVVKPLTHTNDRDIGLVDKKPGTQTHKRDVIDVVSLNAMSFVFPKKIADLTAKFSTQLKKDDYMARELNMRIFVALPRKYPNADELEMAAAGHPVRTAFFALRSNDDDHVADNSVRMEAIAPITKGNMKIFEFKGFIERRDNKSKSPYFKLRLVYINNVLDSGEITPQTDGNAGQTSYPLQNSSLFDVTVE